MFETKEDECLRFTLGNGLPRLDQRLDFRRPDHAEKPSNARLDEGWLMEQINRQGIATVEEVFYAGLDSSGGLYISRKGATKETPGKYGME